jgi:hypothetical protein
MNPGTRRVAALVMMTMIWCGVIGRLGAWRASQIPAGGVLSRTFQGWLDAPVSRHIFLAQYDGTEFNRGRAYSSYTYPFLFAMFLVVTAVKALAGVPYDVAHNALPWIYAAMLTGLLLVVTRPRWPPLTEPGGIFQRAVTFGAIGVVATTPLLWVSLLTHNRDNIHVLAAAAFCYLSTFAFRQRIPIGPWTWTGGVLALWAPIYVPAWILSGLVSRETPAVNRRWLLHGMAVGSLAALNLALPGLVGKMTGVVAVGSDFAYRSGLDGSTQYVSSIPGAVFQPVDPRSWPTGLYVLAALGFGAAFHAWFRQRGGRVFDQLVVLAIPYCTVAILLPQFTSIHPYFTDLLIVVPVCFAVSFWSLQREFAETMTGRGFVLWTLATGALLMTNLLVIAQRLRHT